MNTKISLQLFYKVSGLLSAPILQQKALPLSILLDHGLSFDDGTPGQYLAGVLRALVLAAGQDAAVDAWKASKMSVESFVAKDKIEDFVSANVSGL